MLSVPRGSIYTTIMELGSKRPSPLWFWGPNSIIVVHMDPLRYWFVISRRGFQGCSSFLVNQVVHCRTLTVESGNQLRGYNEDYSDYIGRVEVSFLGVVECTDYKAF